jgi:hypothetical protein
MTGFDARSDGIGQLQGGHGPASVDHAVVLA